MLGEVRKVYPPEGMNHINVQGYLVTEEGTPLTITKQLMALNKAHFIRIADESGDQPAPAPAPTPPAPPQPQPTPQPEPAPQPSPEPDNSLNIDTPTAPPAPSVDQRRAAKLAEVERMSNDELRQYVESIGQDSQGKRRGSLLSLARHHIERVPEDQLG